MANVSVSFRPQYRDRVMWWISRSSELLAPLGSGDALALSSSRDRSSTTSVAQDRLTEADRIFRLAVVGDQSTAQQNDPVVHGDD